MHHQLAKRPPPAQAKRGPKKNSRGSSSSKDRTLPDAFDRAALQRVQRFSPSQEMRYVLYPDRLCAKINSMASLQSAVTTAGEVTQIRSNSLLQTSWGVTDGPMMSIRMPSYGRIYTKYRVFAYSLKVTWVSRGTNHNYVSIYHTPQIETGYIPVVATDMINQAFITSPLAVVRILPAAASAPSMLTMSSKAEVVTVVGSELPKTEEGYTGTLTATGVATDPSELTYIYLMSQNVSGSVFVVSTSPTCLIEFFQDVEFFEPRV